MLKQLYFDLHLQIYMHTCASLQSTLRLSAGNVEKVTAAATRNELHASRKSLDLLQEYLVKLAFFPFKAQTIYQLN